LKEIRFRIDLALEGFSRYWSFPPRNNCWSV